MDSSSVACMAKKILHDENISIDTFSNIFDDFEEVDESYYIQKVIDTGGFNPHFLNSNDISPLKEIESILYFLEEPPLIPNASLSWETYKLMNKNNIRVLLGGIDGDAVFYKGENYFRELFINLNWMTLIKEINGYSKRKKLSRFKIFIGKVIFPIFPQASNMWDKVKNIRQVGDLAIINNDFKHHLNLNELKEVELKSSREANNSKRSQYLYLTSATHQFIFETLDKYAGPFGIELRHPIMDIRLLEFCYGIPTDIKFNHGWDRMLVRMGLADFLPKEVQWRVRKFNSSPVFERNLLLFEEETMDFLMNEKKLKTYIDSEETSKIYNRYKSGNSETDFNDVWRLIILSKWLNNNNYLLSKS